ncbi:MULTISPECIES: hypothetical protein [Emticicia]|uniref:hypothetical protein n=1 Tax=Emticicia TaxID=312278 RepID=UPI0007D8A18E|nr:MULTISPECIES: hypothetical protein [Emticicia]
MTKQQNLLLSLLISIGLFISSCKKDSIETQEENELITTVKLNFTSGGVTQTFKFNDPDGDGGAAPTIDNISLKANTTYTLTIQVLDESKSTINDITNEVSAESDEHLFVYTPTPSNLLTYVYGDKDTNGFVIGLTGTAKTTTAGNGQLKVQLRHQPPVNGKKVKDGTPTPGSDDMNINFNLIVQ